MLCVLSCLWSSEKKGRSPLLLLKRPERLADGRAAADLDDGQIGGGLAEFAGLATKHVLTAAMHVMPTWLVAAHEAMHRGTFIAQLL